MAKNKDPAVLFYTADFLADTTLWKYDELGRYIKLLCLQHLQGGISEEDFLSVTESNRRVSEKFDLCDDGLYRNKRMQKEAEDRHSFCESRRANINKRYENKSNQDKSTSVVHKKNTCHTSVPTSVVHMENENINENVNVIKDIIEYLNTKLGTKYKSNAEYINKHINARLNEGFTLEDFKTVINKKYDEWAGTEMDKFLRPETLFGTKFQQYLNQRVVPKTEKPAEKPKQPPIERYGNFDPTKAFEAACARNFFDED
jgi:uncharacterized phage protein (TIGR02220 family)